MSRALIIGGAAVAACLLLGGGKKKAPPKKPGGKVGDIATAARAELARWEGLDDESPEGRAIVAEYWDSMQAPQGSGLPWSGAFVQHVANTARPGSLMRSARHLTYLKAAIPALERGKFGAFLPTLPLKVGDIIVFTRHGDTEHQWWNVNEDFPSHGDIVVSVDRAGGVAEIIGGNAGPVGAVELSTIPLAADGSAAWPADRNILAVLRLVDDFPQVIATPPTGWRRATFDEVRPEWMEGWSEILKAHRPGEFVEAQDGSHLLAIESHNGPQGWHKGISVLVSDWYQAP